MKKMFTNLCDLSNEILARIMADPVLKAEDVAVAVSTDQAYELLSSICPDIGEKKMAEDIDFQCPT